MLKLIRPFFRILLLSSLMFSSSQVLAAQNTDKAISSYKGQVFDKAQRSLCESEAEEVALRMEEIGYRVFDHTCMKGLFHNQYVVAVQYEYDVLKTIEKLENTVSSFESCEQMKSQAKVDFSKMSADIISVFCRELSSTQAKLQVDYTQNDDFIRDYQHRDQSSSYEQCLQKKRELEENLRENEVRPLLSYCSKKDFGIRMHYTIKSKLDLKTIRGKKVENRSACELNDESLLGQFDEQELNGVMTFCTKRGDQLYKSVLYLDKYFSKVREYKGFAKSGLAQCRNVLENSVEKLKSQGHAPLYSYCQERNDSFIPIVHYQEASQF